MIDVVDAINAALIAELARLGWPPLADLPNGDQGRIVVGETHEFGQLVPPRVILKPRKGDFSARGTTLGATPTRTDPGSKYTAEGRNAVANPAFLTEDVVFDARCWGICPVDADVEPRAGDLDYVFTRGLYTCLLASVQQINPNGFGVSGGTWLQTRHTQRVGQEFLFQLTMRIPVLRFGFGPPAVNGWRPGDPARNSPKAPDPPAGGVQSPGIDHAPAGTGALFEDGMRAPDGTTEAGCEEPGDPP